jgi:hypothetical protein
MPLYRLAYHSAATFGGDRSAICGRIIAGARARNAHYGITGALMLAGGRFVQLLEGRRPHLELVFEHIVQDSRHGDIRLIAFHPLARRSFAKWGMAEIGVDSCLTDDQWRLLADQGDMGGLDALSGALEAAAHRRDAQSHQADLASDEQPLPFARSSRAPARGLQSAQGQRPSGPRMP